MVKWDVNEVTCRCVHLTDFALYSELQRLQSNEAACAKQLRALDPNYGTSMQWKRPKLLEAIAEKSCEHKNGTSAYESCIVQIKSKYGAETDDELQSDLCEAYGLEQSDSSAIKAALTVQIYVAIANWVLTAITLIKIVRFTIPSILNAWYSTERRTEELSSFSKLTLSLSIADYQAFLVLVTTSVRGFNALAKYTANAENLDEIELSAPYMMVSMLFMFWGASLTVANWMTIIHRTIKRGAKSPIAGLGLYYLVFNLVICTMLMVDWIGLFHYTAEVKANNAVFESDNVWTMMGQLTLAIPEFILAISACVYGVLLIRLIRHSMKAYSHSEEMRRKQIQACWKTALIFVIFSGTFLLQAILDVIAGFNPRLYYKPVGIDGIIPVAPLDLAHATASVMVNIIIISVVVKYEEVVQVAHDISAPVVMLIRKTSSMFYSEVLQDEIHREAQSPLPSTADASVCKESPVA
jgi:hypothetical protein